jgi:hypothetical protein
MQMGVAVGTHVGLRGLSMFFYWKRPQTWWLDLQSDEPASWKKGWNSKNAK